MNKIIAKIYKLKIGYSIVLLFLMTYILPWFLLSFIFRNLEEPAQPYIHEPFLFLFVTAVIIAPFCETFLNQYLPYAITGNWHKKKLILLSTISGIIFGLLHMGNLSLFIITGSIGFLFQLWFILLNRKYGTAISFLSVSGVHLLLNLVAVLSIHFSNI